MRTYIPANAEEVCSSIKGCILRSMGAKLKHTEKKQIIEWLDANISPLAVNLPDDDYKPANIRLEYHGNGDRKAIGALIRRDQEPATVAIMLSSPLYLPNFEEAFQMLKEEDGYNALIWLQQQIKSTQEARSRLDLKSHIKGNLEAVKVCGINFFERSSGHAMTPPKRAAEIKKWAAMGVQPYDRLKFKNNNTFADFQELMLPAQKDILDGCVLVSDQGGVIESDADFWNEAKSKKDEEPAEEETAEQVIDLENVYEVYLERCNRSHPGAERIVKERIARKEAEWFMHQYEQGLTPKAQSPWATPEENIQILAGEIPF